MKLLNILFLSVIFCLPASAQSQPVITRYSIEDGLPQQTITGITKDRKGYMWFTTWNGICRFDGHTFVTYRVLPGDSNDLATNRIDDIKIDAHNHLWLLDDEDALYRFSPESGKFSRFTQQTAPVRNIFTLSDGDTWVFQADGSLVKISPGEESMDCRQILDSSSRVGTIISLVQTPTVIWIISDKGVYKFSKEEQSPVLVLPAPTRFYSFRKWAGMFVLGSDNGKLYIYDPQEDTHSILKFSTSGALTRIKAYDSEHFLVVAENDGFFLTDGYRGEGMHYTTSNRLLSNRINALYEDNHRKHIWIAYKNKAQITRIAPFSGYYKHYQLKTQEYDNSPRSISQDHDGRLWVFSKNEALNYYDAKADEFLFFPVSRNNHESRSPKIKRIYFDNQNNLWIAKQPKGLIKVSFKKDLFTLSVPDVKGYPSTNELRSIMEDADSNIWVGGKNGDIQVYGKDKNFLGFLNSDGRLSRQAEKFDAVYALLQDRKGNIWMGTRNEGIIKLLPKGKLHFQLTYYKKNPADAFSLNCNSIFSLKEDKQGRIWIGTLGGGLNFIEKDKDGNERFIHGGNRLAGYPSRFSRIKNICIDHQDNLWLATTSGVLLCKWQAGKLAYIPLVRDSKVKNSLSCDNVYDIFESSRHEIFVTTFGGGLDKLTGFSGQGNGVFTNYSSPRRVSTLPLTLAEDKEGNLWIPSENGLYRLFPRNDSTEIYDSRFLPEGLLLTESRACRLSNGEMLFGTDKGLLSISPERMRRDTYTSNLLVTDIHINGGKKDFTSTLADIVLSHRENSFTIHYETLDMKFPAKIEYAYRLKGFDNWNYVKNNRMAVYTNIPKGNYCFQVKSTNSDGVWSNQAEEIPITILPSFWESVYGIILYILIFILIVAGSAYILFVIYKLRNRVSIEKYILEMKTKFFTDIIHELRTPFTLIIAPLDHMLSQKDLNPVIRQDLALVKRNTKHTLKIINQVLDLQKLQNESKLTVQRIEMAPFIRHIINNFQSLAIQRESEIIFEAKTSPVFLWADPDKLESILFNLLTNAFKYSPKGTVIHLSVEETPADVILRVADQGYGISREKQENIFNRFENYVSSDIFKRQSTGIGLSLVKELVELHKGRITLQSKVNEGSTFTLYFCKGRQHFPPQTEFILTDYDEHVSLSPDDTLFLREDYEVEEDACDSNKSTLLVVDDNQELLSFLHAILSEEFRVMTASNGKEGLEKATKYLPNMIVSDVMMPEMTGIEMVRKLQANIYTCHIPIVLLSSKAEVENRNEGLELGVDDYITKPFSASYLIARIWNIIKQRKRIQALYYSELVRNKEENHPGAPQEKEELRALPQADKDLLDRIVCFIEEHLDYPQLSVDTLVEEAGISRSALFKKIKTLIGISPMELIKNIRLKKAAEFIKEGSDNFTQIAYKTGFKDSQHFSKCFKTVYGVTPTEYRRKAPLST